MKKAIRKTKTFTAVLLLAFLPGFTTSALPVERAGDPIEFKLLANIDKGPLFQLDINNSHADKYIINVKDADGNTLYSERLKGKNVSRKYQMALETEGLPESFNVRFEIVNVKTHETLTYKVTRNNKVVSELLIAKM